MDEARQCFLDALAADAGNVDAQLNLAQLHRSLGRPDDAARCILQVLEQIPGDLAALDLYARISQDVGYDEGRQKALKMIQVIDPDHRAVRAPTPV